VDDGGGIMAHMFGMVRVEVAGLSPIDHAMLTHSYTPMLSNTPFALALTAVVRLSPNAPTTLTSHGCGGGLIVVVSVVKIPFTHSEREREGGGVEGGPMRVSIIAAHCQRGSREQLLHTVTDGGLTLIILRVETCACMVVNNLLTNVGCWCSRTGKNRAA
jgi:hypothetical protein